MYKKKIFSTARARAHKSLSRRLNGNRPRKCSASPSDARGGDTVATHVPREIESIHLRESYTQKWRKAVVIRFLRDRSSGRNIEEKSRPFASNLTKGEGEGGGFGVIPGPARHPFLRREGKSQGDAHLHVRQPTYASLEQHKNARRGVACSRA